MSDQTQTGPHEWSPIKVRDEDGPVCEHCFHPKGEHPITGWVKARPIEPSFTPFLDLLDRAVMRRRRVLEHLITELWREAAHLDTYPGSIFPTRDSFEGLDAPAKQARKSRRRNR